MSEQLLKRLEKQSFDQFLISKSNFDLNFFSNTHKHTLEKILETKFVSFKKIK